MNGVILGHKRASVLLLLGLRLFRLATRVHSTEDNTVAGSRTRFYAKVQQLPTYKTKGLSCGNALLPGDKINTVLT